MAVLIRLVSRSCLQVETSLTATPVVGNLVVVPSHQRRYARHEFTEEGLAPHGAILGVESRRGASRGCEVGVDLISAQDHEIRMASCHVSQPNRVRAVQVCSISDAYLARSRRSRQRPEGPPRQRIGFATDCQTVLVGSCRSQALDRFCRGEVAVSVESHTPGALPDRFTRNPVLHTEHPRTVATSPNACVRMRNRTDLATERDSAGEAGEKGRSAGCALTGGDFARRPHKQIGSTISGDIARCDGRAETVPVPDHRPEDLLVYTPGPFQPSGACPEQVNGAATHLDRESVTGSANNKFRPIVSVEVAAANA